MVLNYYLENRINRKMLKIYYLLLLERKRNNFFLTIYMYPADQFQIYCYCIS